MLPSGLPIVPGVPVRGVKTPLAAFRPWESTRERPVNRSY